MAVYLAYRVHLNDTSASGEGSLFSEKKEEIFNNSIFEIKEKAKIALNYYGDFYLFHRTQLSEDIHVFQIAKDKTYTKPIIKKNRIEEVEENQNPFVRVILSIKHQVALIQNDTTVFAEIDTTKNRLQLSLNYGTNGYGIYVKLIEISDFEDLEHELERYDSISEIDLHMSPPNFFKGSKLMDKLRKEAHEDTNYLDMRIVFKNKIDGLKYSSKVASNYLKKIAAGVGSYKITGVVDGVKQVINSIKHHVRIKFRGEPAELDLKVLEEKMADISKIKKDE